MLLPNLSFISIYLSKNYVYVRGCNFKLYNKAGRNDDQGLLLKMLLVVLNVIIFLIMKRDVLEAVKDDKFFIYSIEHIDDGFEILTGMEAGKIKDDGTYP